MTLVLWFQAFEDLAYDVQLWLMTGHFKREHDLIGCSTNAHAHAIPPLPTTA